MQGRHREKEKERERTIKGESRLRDRGRVRERENWERGKLNTWATQLKVHVMILTTKWLSMTENAHGKRKT